MSIIAQAGAISAYIRIFGRARRRKTHFASCYLVALLGQMAVSSAFATTSKESTRINEFVSKHERLPIDAPETSENEKEVLALVQKAGGDSVVFDKILEAPNKKSIGVQMRLFPKGIAQQYPYGAWAQWRDGSLYAKDPMLVLELARSSARHDLNSTIKRWSENAQKPKQSPRGDSLFWKAIIAEIKKTPDGPLLVKDKDPIASYLKENGMISLLSTYQNSLPNLKEAINFQSDTRGASAVVNIQQSRANNPAISKAQEAPPTPRAHAAKTDEDPPKPGKTQNEHPTTGKKPTRSRAAEKRGQVSVEKLHSEIKEWIDLSTSPNPPKTGLPVLRNRIVKGIRQETGDQGTPPVALIQKYLEAEGMRDLVTKFRQHTEAEDPMTYLKLWLKEKIRDDFNFNLEPAQDLLGRSIIARMRSELGPEAGSGSYQEVILRYLRLHRIEPLAAQFRDYLVGRITSNNDPTRYTLAPELIAYLRPDIPKKIEEKTPLRLLVDYLRSHRTWPSSEQIPLFSWIESEGGRVQVYVNLLNDIERGYLPNWQPSSDEINAYLSQPDSDPAHLARFLRFVRFMPDRWKESATEAFNRDPLLKERTAAYSNIHTETQLFFTDFEEFANALRRREEVGGCAFAKIWAEATKLGADRNKRYPSR